MRILLLISFILTAQPVFAHVGSPDVYYEGSAGPYKLFITVRPPEVIPGVAQIEIRSSSPDLREVRITPLRITGPGADLAPTPDSAERSKQDPQFFTGRLWLMLRGSWQVRVQADGAQGKGELAVPVPAVAKRALPMQRALGVLLLALMGFLAVGLVSLAGAGVCEAKLRPGEAATPALRRRARIASGVTAALVLLILFLGNMWWTAEADFIATSSYRLPQVVPSLEHGNRLLLRLQNPNGARWAEPLRLDDLIPDHNHLMHAFLIRVPQMDRLWHLHPDQVETGVFALDLPNIPAGRYQIFTDIVHRTGFPETMVGEIDLPDVAGRPLAGDDAEAVCPPLAGAQPDRVVAPLSGGARMVWERDQTPLRAKQPYSFRFRLEDGDGKPVEDVGFYMGMLGHAVFVRTDLTTFAHVHPSGTVSMAALALAQAGLESKGADPHAKHSPDGHGLPPEVSFPYGFPQPGDYRLFIQVRRAGRIETGVFDVRVNE